MMWVWMAIGLVLFWGAIALLVTSVVSPNQKAARPDPVTLLDERLARGEITSEQYRELRQLITTGH